MEEKQNGKHEIVADFTNPQTIIRGNAFAKGYYTVAVMNYNILLYTKTQPCVYKRHLSKIGFLYNTIKSQHYF